MQRHHLEGCAEVRDMNCLLSPLYHCVPAYKVVKGKGAGMVQKTSLATGAGGSDLLTSEALSSHDNDRSSR